MRRRSSSRGLLVLLALLLPTVLTSAGAAAVPANFEDTLVTKVSRGTALAFTPDGRLLITSQVGTLHVYKDGTRVQALDLTSSICNDKERGLIGVAVDPAFTTNRLIYVYYTFKKHGVCEDNTSRSPVNRVSSFTLPDNNVISRTSESVLVDNIPSPGGIHNAGDLHFGKDGNLYISVGDGGCDLDDGTLCGSRNGNARDQHTLLGKILRITPSGGIPAGNPYQGPDSARCNATGRTDPGKKCQETYASGLRNPYRTAFDPNDAGTRFFISDVGQDTWEEIDLGQAGADYGWNIREGHCAVRSSTDCGPPPAGMTNPVYDYLHSTGCSAVTAGAFVPNGIWPAQYDGAYLYGDYVCGRIFSLKPAAGGGFTRTDFATGLSSSSITGMIFGPHGSTKALYYLNHLNGGEVRRIAYTGPVVNRQPNAVASANPTYGGPLPLTVNFDGRGSSDPDGDTLSYEWDFGDGSPRVTGATTTHEYATAGTYTATLRVRDGRNGEGTATVRIDPGNTPPTPQIQAPTTGKCFRVGEVITLTGSANDTEDGGAVPDSALTWTVIKFHDNHTHPFLAPTSGNNVEMPPGPDPEELAATKTTYLEIELSATDRQGLRGTVTQKLNPCLVDLTFATGPTGLRVELNGTSVTAPHTLTSWENYSLSVNAPSQTDGTGQGWVFDHWSDNGPAAHAVTTPSSPATYTATFNAGPSTRTFPAEADARIQEANASTNYATSYLRADGGPDPDVDSYLRFTVSGLSGAVTSAKLRLYAYTNSGNGPAVYSTSNGWSETGLNWNNLPARTSGATDDKGVIPANSWVEYNVTSFVTGNGTFSFVLATGSNDGIDIYSREAASLRPELVVTAGGGGDTSPPDTTIDSGPSGTVASSAASFGFSSSETGSSFACGLDGAAFAACTSPKSYTGLANGSHTFQVRATDPAGLTDPSPASRTWTVATAGTTPGTFAPEADARVQEANASTNYATSYLRADGGSDRDVDSYLRFTVSGLTGSVTSAKLRVFMYTGSGNGPAVYSTTSGWSETGITWSNRPARTSAATDDKGSIPNNSWVEYNVKPFVTGNGTYSFVIATSSSDGVDIYARDAASRRPELVVTVG